MGFTGGYNLANEYFNVTHPYGYWKDTGLRLEGDAVRNLTLMFLEMWNAIRANDIDDDDFSTFFPETGYKAREREGFVQPYGDSPLDDETVGENVYLAMADMARNYLWYVTPYLIITNEMTRTLRLAAKSGVDVRIITPGIPDKKIIYRVTRSYYRRLRHHQSRLPVLLPPLRGFLPHHEEGRSLRYPGRLLEDVFRMHRGHRELPQRPLPSHGLGADDPPHVRGTVLNLPFSTPFTC